MILFYKFWLYSIKSFHIFLKRIYERGIKFMEYAKDEIFTINYNKEKDKLEFPKKKIMRGKRNKILSMFLTIGIVFTIFDIAFVYYFFSLLAKI
jgi:hypothetical protein